MDLFSDRRRPFGERDVVAHSVVASVQPTFQEWLLDEQTISLETSPASIR